MSTRREFISSIPIVWISSSAVANARIQAERETLQDILDRLRDKVREVMPDVKKLQVTYDPSDPKVPLMVVAFRV